MIVIAKTTDKRVESPSTDGTRGAPSGAKVWLDAETLRAMANEWKEARALRGAAEVSGPAAKR